MLLVTYVPRNLRPIGRIHTGPVGNAMERPGVLRADQRIVPIERVSHHGRSGILEIISSEGDVDKWMQYASDYRGLTIGLQEVHLRPPIPDARKIICIGLNYPGHAKEQGLAAPLRPLYFAKAPTALIGAYDDICLPAEECGADYEVELGVVIGRQGISIPPDQAMSYVAGFTVINDVSARIWQREDGQWFRAKSRDTFCPCGPGIVPRSFITDVSQLRLTTHVNHVLRQDDVVGRMRFDIPRLIADISAHIRLEPGDILATGSPAGSGGFLNPPVYLRDGDVVRCTISDIGSLENRITVEG